MTAEERVERQFNIWLLQLMYDGWPVREAAEFLGLMEAFVIEKDQEAYDRARELVMKYDGASTDGSGDGRQKVV